MSSLKYSLRNECNEPLDIEAQRRDRIEENKRRLLELGLLQAQKQISDAVRNSKKSQEPRKRKPSNFGAFIAKEFQYEPRRSGRVQSLPPKVYNMDYIFRDMSADDTRLSKDGGSKRLRLLERGNSSRVTRNSDGWQPWMGIASFKAADKAKEAAHVLLTELQQKGVEACIKEMSDSQVSGGFWCQLPMGFCGQFQMTKRTMRLHYGDEATEVVFLPRPGGGGGSQGGGVLLPFCKSSFQMMQLCLRRWMSSSSGRTCLGHMTMTPPG
ncbi:hypothetical protein CEUSTIGMA_g8548.t1 [Chlamydomonas eustigma]|uniref:Uncharacterized protein n=1 Tax=Chlamydomonas eustigma TaxID=1157962 RepID=A0A250XDF3_9CHLO|nr:hypothetical protein CEUSTIGMA_g8548.t1 [Chlamydomonas eustigma]|eukprot:GAX81114.1 hypothetical protein CEUSTIGMA_g8548.t1 [Chlamydomonas eustigma]